MNIYKTTEIARQFNIHPNTVRLYESLGLIPKAQRSANGYRMFSDLHIEQIKLARLSLKVEVLQNGLRKKAIAIIKLSATGHFDEAIRETDSYIKQIVNEQKNAEEAIVLTNQLLLGEEQEESSAFFTRKQTAELLQITMDTLRNWEMNGLLTIKRKQNGYRIYTNGDIRLLKIIRVLRCANYSLSSILRMLLALSRDPATNIRKVIDTPGEDEDIITACDKLFTSLRHAEQNARRMRVQLENIKEQFTNITL